ncbi:MAG: TolB family protein, partial [Acidimicrobiia bacterium]
GTDSLGNGDSPRWSPDGNSIAFVDSGAVYTVDPDGSNQVTITSNGEFPVWSPDSAHLCFRRDERKGHDVWRVAADGSGATNLTKDIRRNARAIAWR